MDRWKWFQRPEEPIDQIGPATAYPNRCGAHPVAERPDAERPADRKPAR